MALKNFSANCFRKFKRLQLTFQVVWLTERYCLYAADRRGRVWRGNIHHARWPLQPAEADIACNTMADQLQLVLPQRAPLLHFAPRLDVVAWTLEAVEAKR